MEPTANSKFLILPLRFIGDVLLATPLALSIKAHLPEASVDFLVLEGTESVLAQNPYIDRVHTVARNASAWVTFFKLYRKYDFAIGVSSSDRTAIFATGAGKRSIGFSHFHTKEWWKRIVLSECRFFDDTKHVVALMLTQLQSLGIPAIPRVTMGFSSQETAWVRSTVGSDYVLLHPYTRQGYKYWPATSWARLSDLIREAGARPVFSRTGLANDEKQLRAIEEAAEDGIETFPVGLTMPQFAAAVGESLGVVGVDTVGTHIAAALDAKVIALFGPTLVNKWGPWPNGWQTSNPYLPKGQIQSRGSITVLQKNWPCVPCGQQYCYWSDRNEIECLVAGLSPELVFEHVEQKLLPHVFVPEEPAILTGVPSVAAN